MTDMTKMNINIDGKTMSGYLALPEKTPAAGIIILQEIFGVNKVMRDICDGFAQHGFAALCPDLFWRIEPNIDITDQTQKELDKAFDLFGKFDAAAGIKDIAAAIAALRQHEACHNNKIGAVGFCLGGQLAYLAAVRTNVDCAIGYYGVNIQNFLSEAKDNKDNMKPLMLHIAGKDQFVPKDAQEKITAALQSHPKAILHHYPERDHAFARIGGEHYHKDDAQKANERSLAFLRENLV